MNSKERCLAAINGRPVDRVPVFPLLMFFAQQRYGITYREFATNGRALADAQLSIRERFPLDAITACSDAFRVTADLGAEMAYPEDGPPFAKQPLVRTRADLDQAWQARPPTQRITHGRSGPGCGSPGKRGRRGMPGTWLGRYALCGSLLPLWC